MNKALMSVFTSLWLFSAPGFAQVRELPSPAGQGSGQPNLAVGPDGRVYLSWIERLNGPAVAAAGRRVAVAWFTGTSQTSRVKPAISDDAGETFGQPIVIDDGNPAGRVDVSLLDDGGALVCRLEKLPEGGAARVRRVSPDGKLDDSVTVAPSGTARSAGFPQMARAGGEIVFAWTGSRVFTAKLALPQK